MFIKASVYIIFPRLIRSEATFLIILFVYGAGKYFWTAMRTILDATTVVETDINSECINFDVKEGLLILHNEVNILTR